MDFNSDVTKQYIEYNKKIDEIWQDQVDAGPTFGRADEKEVTVSFQDLIGKIRISALTPEQKAELEEKIQSKLALVPAREREILEAEANFTREQANSYRNAIARYKAMSMRENSRYYELFDKIYNKGYMIFFSAEELDKMFTDEMTPNDLKRANAPIISEDLKGILKDENNRGERSE